MTEESKAAQDRYLAALHAIQSGVKMIMDADPAVSRQGECSSKSLRVGVNAAMIDASALALLLVAKKIITEDEYFTALAEAAEKEVRTYEERLSKMLGGRAVKLA